MNYNRNIKNRLKYSILVLLYYTTYKYISISISPRYAYYGIDLSYSLFKDIQSTIIVVLISFLTYSSKLKSSSIVINLILFLVIIPFCSYYTTSDNQLIFFIAVLTGFILLTIITKNFKFFKLQKLAEGKSLALLIAISLLFFSIGLSLFLNDLPNFAAFNFNNIYTIRSNYSSNFMLEYSKSWSVYVIIPMMLAYSIEKKYTVIIALNLLFMLFMFISSGAKYTLFLIPFIFFIYYSQKKENPLIFISKIFVLILLLSFALLKLKIYTPIHFLFTRPLLIPSWLSFEYYEYFNQNEKLLFAEIFPSIIKSPYQISSALLIGQHLFPDGGGTWANTNMYGNSYANLGLSGPIIFSLIFAIILIIADSVSRNNIVFITSISISSMTVYTAPLFSVLASRGLLFCILLCWLLFHNKIILSRYSHG